MSFPSYLNIMKARPILFVFTALFATLLFAQQRGAYDQRAVGKLYDLKAPSLESIPEITFNYRVVRSAAEFWSAENVGNKTLLQMINRSSLSSLAPGDTVIVPSQYGLDMRAYSPFPRYYAGAEELDKLLIVDKSKQVWGGYEFGKLKRWGVVSTGSGRGKSALTPNGRFNVNWKEESRISSESPPGEKWLLNFVTNIYLERGIHTHEYTIPMGGAASHGCIRMIRADAKFIYDWTDQWQRQGKEVVKQGSMALVLGQEHGAPPFFAHEPSKPRLKYIELPASPWDVEAGSAQQRMFDRRRERHQSSTDAR
jgi:hypothetical protein